MKGVAAVRKALKVRTAFNILGPLLNPASTKYSLIGVYSPALSPLMGATLQELGIEKALIVHSHGLDELTPMGDAHIVEVTQDRTTSYRCISFPHQAFTKRTTQSHAPGVLPCMFQSHSAAALGQVDLGTYLEVLTVNFGVMQLFWSVREAKLHVFIIAD